jgi:hypothetical protein
MSDIKRVTELHIISKLSAAVSGHPFYPFFGGTAFANKDEVEPPLSVVAIVDAEKVMQHEGTWLLTGSVQVITHVADISSQAHATLSRSIYGALDSIPAEVVNAAYSFHGIHITGMSSTTDSESQCHADIIKFVCGAGG